MNRTTNLKAVDRDGDDRAYSPLTEPEKAIAAPAPEQDGMKPEVVAELRKRAEAYPAFSLGEIARMPVDEKQTLLGDRWLCRCGMADFVAPMGIGKSSALRYATARWSIGKTAFGITPYWDKIKVLIIQAENDDGDETEMVRDVYAQFNDEEQKLLDERVHVIRVSDLCGLNFIIALAWFMEKYKPDLVVLDPLNSYLGGDPSNPDVVMPFLRSWLMPQLQKHRCGMILVHHTPKTRAWDTSKWKIHDWSGAAAGSSEIGNVARAILVIDPTDNPDVFRFIAAKRWKRIGWKNDLGEPVHVKVFKHSKTGMLWTPATEAEIATVEKEQKLKKAGRTQRYKTKDILKPLLENENGANAQALLAKLNAKGCPITKTTLYTRLTEEEENGVVKVDKDGIYTLTSDGLELFP